MSASGKVFGLAKRAAGKAWPVTPLADALLRESGDIGELTNGGKYAPGGMIRPRFGGAKKRGQARAGRG